MLSSFKKFIFVTAITLYEAFSEAPTQSVSDSHAICLVPLTYIVMKPIFYHLHHKGSVGGSVGIRTASN